MMALAGFIMRGHTQTVLVALVAGLLSILILPLGYFSGAALALVTLRKGAAEGGIDVLLATLGMAVLLPFVLSGDPWFGLWYALGMWAPVWLLAVILRQTISLTLTIATATFIGVAIVVIAYLVVADPAAWWRETMQTILTQAQQAGANVPDPEGLKAVMEKAADIMTGMVSAMLIGGYVFCIALARWWQSLLFNPGGFRSEILQLRLDRVSALVVLATMIATMVDLGGMASMFTELVMLLLVMCSIFGVALIHHIVELRKMSVLWLVTLYILSIILMPQFVMLTGTLALMDSWMDFRRMLSPPPSSGMS
ncbi:MAG: hypothetical protein OEW08_11435 [Gammaproteobacteria bacterium]|nr:hypothetical protein [Gammaproteobacteria bacterium]